MADLKLAQISRRHAGLEVALEEVAALSGPNDNPNQSNDPNDEGVELTEDAITGVYRAAPPTGTSVTLRVWLLFPESGGWGLVRGSEITTSVAVVDGIRLAGADRIYFERRDANGGGDLIMELGERK